MTTHRVGETRGRGKAALCLCSGGIAGALFEIGVLAGLEDVLGAAFSTGFDIYVGASAGAGVASVVAQGLPASRIAESVGDPDSAPQSLLRQDNVYPTRWGAWLKAAARLSLEAMRACVPGRLRGWAADRAAELHSSPLHGVFSTDRYQEALRAFFVREGLSNRFGELERELYIVANELHSAERVIFGEVNAAGVEIATAVAASSAIPLFFEPVRIGSQAYFDGGFGNVPIDVAVAHGADRVVVVNPVAPVRASDLGAIDAGGLGPLAVVDQARRIAAEAGVRLAIRRQLAQHRNLEMLLIEPLETDTAELGRNPMSSREGEGILESARSGMRRELWRLPANRRTVERLVDNPAPRQATAVT